MKITVDRKVIEKALETLQEATTYTGSEAWSPSMTRDCEQAITALRTALGQQYMTNAAGELEPVTIVQTGVGIWKMELEPVAWMLKSGHGTAFADKLTDEQKSLTWNGRPMWKPLYDAPPKRKPLTDEEIDKAWRSCDYTVPWEQHRIDIARAIEAAHGIKE